MHTNLVWKGQSALSGFMRSHMPSKGITEPWCAQAVASSVSRAGFGRLSFRSDTEPAILALKRVVGHLLTTKFGTEIVPEEASMGDSSSNGLAEHAVREGESEGAKPCTWVEKVDWPRIGIKLTQWSRG